MLDLKFIRDNIDAVKANTANRHVSANPDLVVELYDKRNALLKELETLRAARNTNADKMKAKLSPEDRAKLIEEGKRLKESIAELEKRHEETEKRLTQEALRLPNMSHPEAPVAEGEAGNRQLRTWGKPPSFSFPQKDHVEIGQNLALLDFESGAKVAGQKFYYLKNEAVILELALLRYAMDVLMREGFTPFITPDVAREDIVAGHGFNPRGPESNIYTLEGTDLCLVATAEFTLGGYNSGKILAGRGSSRHVCRHLPLLPAGGWGRRAVLQGALPRAPVHQGGDVRVLPPLRIRCHAGTAHWDRGENLPGVGDSLPDRGHVHGRPRGTRVSQVRYRGVDAGAG